MALANTYLVQMAEQYPDFVLTLDSSFDIYRNRDPVISVIMLRDEN